MKWNYFNFRQFKDKILMTNDLGKHIFVSLEDFRKIINKTIDLNSDIGKELIQKQFIYEGTNLFFCNENYSSIRQIKSHLNIATSLHIFVVTTGCNTSCIYCQANKGNENTKLRVMDELMAEKAVDIALQSPNKYLSFEFQGGEPLINFNVIKQIVLYAEQHKGNHEIFYNVVTNLTLITDEILEFFKKYRFDISTSLDGPIYVHDFNRPYKSGKGTFEDVTQSINKIRNAGLRVGAIQTTTRHSLNYSKEIVNTYQELGFDSIFLRPLTPLGKANKSWNLIGYSAKEFLDFYRKALDELFTINSNGTYIKENHAGILYSRIQGNAENYMELRSPCGASIGQIAYYSDGNIFTCDEGRMLYEMGYDTFKLGNVFENSYYDLINNGVSKTVCAASILETIPSCCDCVYQPYCGTCPVVTYSKNDDIIEKSPFGYKCTIYSGIMDILFEKILENDKKILDILEMWSN